jgi:hypothetical protein
MELNMQEGTVTVNGKQYECTKLPAYMQGILDQGGLIASLDNSVKNPYTEDFSHEKFELKHKF